MEPFSLAWAAQSMGGQAIGDVTGKITSVCIDSRQAKPGALFFALKGENSDGHEYVAQALKAGAVAAVVERKIEGLEAVAASGEKTGAQIVVPAALRALGDLARHYRRQFAIPIIGITGSVGKTSTKEMIAAVLRTTYNALASEKNYNNEIGVPLTLFNLNKTHEVAVIEMGMRGLGQIDYLAEIAEPTIGVITNIGHAHIELLGSQENIARAKAELFARLPENGVAIMPDGSNYWRILRDAIPATCREIGITTAGIRRGPDVRVDSNKTQIHADGTVTFRVRVGPTTQSIPVKLQAVGTHHVPNALAALAVAYALNIPTARAIEALETWQGAEGRMKIRHAPDNITILDDCYNASPESMKSAVETLSKMSNDGVAVLGDMRELGQYTDIAHRIIGQHVYHSNCRLLVAVGDLAKKIEVQVERLRQHLEPGNLTDDEEWNTILQDGRTWIGDSHIIKNNSKLVVVCYPDAQEAAAHIKELVQPGDTVLVKGSRAMGMEVIVNALMGENDGKLHA